MYGDISFTLIGTVTSDPEENTLRNGTKRLSISIAVNVPIKKEEGKYEEQTTWVRVALFGKAAERKSLTWIKKGSAVYVRGQIASYSHETGDGKKLTMYNFRPEVIRAINPKGGSSSEARVDSAGSDDEFPDAFG